MQIFYTPCSSHPISKSFYTHLYDPNLDPCQFLARSGEQNFRAKNLEILILEFFPMSVLDAGRNPVSERYGPLVCEVSSP